MKRTARWTLGLLGPLLAFSTMAGALPPTTPAAPEKSSLEIPQLLEDVGFDQRLGEPVALDLMFRDETGEPVRLGDLFGDRPVLLIPVYYDCPMLCTMILNGFASSLMPLSFTPGEEFEVVVVSFNPRETPAKAAAAKERTVRRYGHPETAPSWHFLTGDEAEIARFTESIGFRYEWDAASQQYAHTAGIVLATADGTIARYFFGIEYAPRDLRLGLIEAADNKIGTVVDKALLYCFKYDPASGKYSAVVLNIIRLGGIVVIVILTLFITLMLRRDKSRQLHPGRA